ncbi:hypothetical protein [Ktedonospora formicarum]|uniref:Uncharacterized protein n=1 Tax=Ktedonospora formicarum TaxID=2778364 RepID=A0A8J3MW78_9CHLR|nr:hypothetical protein [Ktedonospora formicarum]GHO51162.1 hypothetical protein KSX_93250 [Ktedonospora formicarum]
MLPEVFKRPKRRVTPQLHAFLTALASLRERGQPIPDALALALPAEVVSLLLQDISPTNLPRQSHSVIFHTVKLGPYVRSRWSEDAHTSTISLSLLNDSPPFPSPLRASNACASIRE